MSHNSKFDIDKSFVSIYDKFLNQFDKTHPPTASQVEERQKYERIAKMRDKTDSEDPQ